jgi:hypothetical protein
MTNRQPVADKSEGLVDDRPGGDKSTADPRDAAAAISLPLALLALVALATIVGLLVSGLAAPLGAGAVQVIVRPQ